MSKLSPKMALAMTEHSICHPGRPGPQGEGHAGSPGFDAFHNAKSDGDLRPVFADSSPDHEREVQTSTLDDRLETRLRLPQANLGCLYSRVPISHTHGRQLCRRPMYRNIHFHRRDMQTRFELFVR